jgi:hypothetical protein
MIQVMGSFFYFTPQNDVWVLSSSGLFFHFQSRNLSLINHKSNTLMCLPPSSVNPTGYVKNNPAPTPCTKEILAAIPARCFEKSTVRSLSYALTSVVLTVGCALLARACIPMELWALPLWIAYGFIEGTIATGCWVVAHECGHGGGSLSDFSSRYSTSKTNEDEG